MFGTWSPWLTPAFAPIAPPAPPAARGPAATAVIPDFRGMGMARAIAAAREARLAIAVSGTGRVVEQHPPPGPSRAAPRVWLRLADGTAIAPAARAP
jgi:cell division protein FtsI (penicillin-binding protein 3)